MRKWINEQRITVNNFMDYDHLQLTLFSYFNIFLSFLLYIEYYLFFYRV